MRRSIIFFAVFLFSCFLPKSAENFPPPADPIVYIPCERCYYECLFTAYMAEIENPQFRQDIRQTCYDGCDKYICHVLNRTEYRLANCHHKCVEKSLDGYFENCSENDDMCLKNYKNSIKPCKEICKAGIEIIL